MISFLKRSVARRGVSGILLLFVISILLVVLLGYLAILLRPDARRSRGDQVVRVYCASGVAGPVEQLLAVYNKTLDANIELVRTGGSGELAGQIRMEFETGMKDGADLYITADELLLEAAHRDGIVAERFELARQRPVIAVRADSSLNITGLNDLVSRPELKYGIASQGAAVGRMVRQIAQRDGLLEQLESGKTTDAENVMTLAQALRAGSLDAAVVWDTTVAQVNRAAAMAGTGNGLEIAAPADSLETSVSRIGIGVVANSSEPTASLKFARYLTAPETGRQAFVDFGFDFIEGDRWEEVPEIHLYCGSMFTPVLEETVRDFARREGVSIYPRWEGCGKLVASMKSIEDEELFPDAYLACDAMFLEEVKDRFRAPVTISSNRIVMAVRSDLETKITGPADLFQVETNGSSLRIGICDPEQSALGRLTKTMLTNDPFSGVYGKLETRAAVSVDVGPTLISQLLAGGLDVAFVYRSNVLAADPGGGRLRIVEIQNAIPSATATQPWAISVTTRNGALMERFFEWINQPGIRERFRKFGFELLVDE